MMVTLNVSVPKVPTVPVVVGASEAIELAGSTRVVFADVRWYLDGRDARAIHEAGRIPGSVFVDVDRDLARPSNTADEGRHPFPSPAAFAKLWRSDVSDWLMAQDAPSEALEAVCRAKMAATRSPYVFPDGTVATHRCYT